MASSRSTVLASDVDPARVIGVPGPGATHETRDLERERACFALLRALAGREAVRVGCYAVSAYGPPRFSVDLDLVTPEKEVPGFQAALREAGLARVRGWAGGARLGGRAERE